MSQKTYALGVVQKIRVKIGEREGSANLTQNVTVGERGVHQFNSRQFKALYDFTFWKLLVKAAKK